MTVYVQGKAQFLHKLQISETLAFLPLPLLWCVGVEALSKPSPEPLLQVTTSGIGVDHVNGIQMFNRSDKNMAWY